MEPIGVALGTAALLSTVLDIFRIVTSFRSHSETSGVLFRQLDLEREVLLRWATEVGLHPSNVPSSQCAIPVELLPLVHNTVAMIGALLAKATSFKPANADAEMGIRDMRLVRDSLQSELQSSQRLSRLSRTLARLGWAIGEEDRLKDLISTIHAYNTSLHNLIPKPLQVSLDGSLMQIVLAEQDEDKLLEIQQASSNGRKALSIVASVTALQQTRSAAPPLTNQLILHRSKLASLGSDMARHLTRYDCKGQPVDVLIEWRAYQMPPNSAKKAYYINTCLDLARLLHASQNLPAYRTLDCLGIIDDVEFQPAPRIGVVYRVPSIAPTPPSLDGSCVRIYTLYDFINRKEFIRPRLEQRFELARSLATGLHRIFVSRWYHKNLNSKNILFFICADPMKDERSLLLNPNHIQYPYLSGFDYARPDSPDEMTIKPEIDEFSDRYRHPLCTRPDSRESIRFTRRFDTYSMGVILMELGRWETADTMHKDLITQKIKSARKGQVAAPPPSLDSFQKYLRTRCIESLGFRMGKIYMDAVRFCLDHTPDTNDPYIFNGSADIEEALVSRFNKEVVAELVRCTA
ncbi:hypothetical protein FQN54_001044 [Arachnomyces sp. PD_36]|nr:hypothetical protein FQN54_001044 [Arachnomyces sp. PD_36]